MIVSNHSCFSSSSSSSRYNRNGWLVVKHQVTYFFFPISVIETSISLPKACPIGLFCAQNDKQSSHSSDDGPSQNEGDTERGLQPLPALLPVWQEGALLQGLPGPPVELSGPQGHPPQVSAWRPALLLSLFVRLSSPAFSASRWSSLGDLRWWCRLSDTSFLLQQGQNVKKHADFNETMQNECAFLR